VELALLPSSLSCTMSSLAVLRFTFSRPRQLFFGTRRLTKSAPGHANPAAQAATSSAPPPRTRTLLPALLAAGLAASTTYFLASPAKEQVPAYKEPTQATFDAAIKELKEFMPDDFVSQDRDVLINYGHSDWTGEHLSSPLWIWQVG